MAIRGKGERRKSLTKMPLLLPPAAFFASGLAKRPSSSLSRSRVMGRDEQSETRGSRSEERGNKAEGEEEANTLTFRLGWGPDPVGGAEEP